ncbi:MAG TPA: hypothetical protein VGB63_03015 [Pedobacter sp.]|jgi:hypothetical protein
MPILSESEALELKRLESIATEKRVTYLTIDEELILKNCENPELVAEFIAAKKELTEAVNEYNAYRAKLACTYDI